MEKQYVIYNVDEMLSRSHGSSYKGEIAVFESGDENEWQFYCKDDKPIYVNAFTHALVVSGSSQLYINGEARIVKEKTLCLISPIHLTCFTRRSHDFKCIFLCIRKDFIDGMLAYNIRHHIIRGLNTCGYPVACLRDEDFRLLRNCLDDIMSQIGRCDHRYQLELVQNALARYYWEADNMLGCANLAKNGDEGMQSRYVRILQNFTSLLLNHFKTEHTVPFYAQRLNITPQYLTMIVKKQTGQTVSDFISEMLYSEARNLLRTSDSSIQQIADLLNFADQASFCKFFKRFAHLSPQEFRQSRL